MKRSTPTYNKSEQMEWVKAVIANPPSPDECVDWPFTGDPSIKTNGRKIRVKRYLYDYYNPIPSDHKKLFTTCGNDKCLNWHHIKIGIPEKSNHKISNKLDQESGIDGEWVQFRSWKVFRRNK